MITRSLLYVAILVGLVNAIDVGILSTSDTGHQRLVQQTIKDFFSLDTSVVIKVNQKSNCPDVWIVTDAAAWKRRPIGCPYNTPVFSVFVPNPGVVIDAGVIGGFDSELPLEHTLAVISKRMPSIDIKDLVVFGIGSNVPSSGSINGISVHQISSDECMQIDIVNCFMSRLREFDPKTTIIHVSSDRSSYANNDRSLFREFWVRWIMENNWLVTTSSSEFYATGIPIMLVESDIPVLSDALAEKISEYDRQVITISNPTSSIVTINKKRTNVVGVYLK